MTSLSIRARRIASATLAVALTLGSATFVATSASAADDPRSETVYNSVPANPAPSYPSQAFTATQTSEFGDYIQLAGENRVAQTVTLGLNSWGCETGGGATCVTTPGATFSEPVTLTFYERAGTEEAPLVGAVVGSLTQTFDMPFRPSADPINCPATPTKWFDAEAGTCQNGDRFEISFDFTEQGLTLPNDVIVSVQYPTNTYGPGEAAPATDSLNVNLISGGPSVGTDVDGDVMFIKSNVPGYAGSGGVGVFSSQAEWTPYGLDISITAAPATVATEPASYLNGFENADTGLFDVTAVKSDPAGQLAAAGCYYAEAPVTNGDAEASVFTRYDGYTTSFPEGGYTASADFYLDENAPAGNFDWSHAINGTDGNHQRDFVFSAINDGAGTWTIGASNNAVNSAPWVTPVTDGLELASSGWYTFQHTFYAEDGLLYADLSVLDSSGDVLETWTLGGNAADQVPAIVGGNRYGWLVNNSFEGLLIDNVLLNHERPSVGCYGDINVSVTSTGSQAVTDGSVDLIDPATEDVVATATIDSDGNATFSDVEAGDYYLYFYGTTGRSAALWYGDASTIEDAALFTVEAGQTNNLEMVLPEGGVIYGNIAGAGGAAFDGYTVLVTLDFQPVQFVEADADGDYAFTQVPAGRYHVVAIDYTTGSFNWVLAGAANSKPLTVTMPTDDDWSVEARDFTLADTPAALLYGTLRAPSAWDTPAECVSAKVGTAVVSQYCGPVDSQFALDRVPTYSDVALTFSKAHEIPSTAGFQNDGTPVYWPSSEDTKYYGIIKTQDADQTYVPVYWFKDINASIVGYIHILWMGDQGISRGYDDGSYKPQNNVTRKQMAIFLWNYMGQPSVDLTAPSAFSDTAYGEPGYPAIAWMVEEGITHGNADGTFGGDKDVTRKQMAQFLYNLAGKPTVTLPATSPFKDIKAGDSSYVAMVWLAQTGISVGYSDGSFRPNEDISRKHMAFFLEKFDMWS